MRYKISKNEKNLGFVELIANGKEQSIKLRTIEENTKDIEYLKTFFQQIKKYYCDNNEVITEESIISRLRENGYGIVPTEEGQYKMQIVMTSKGANIAKSTPSTEIDNKEIGESVGRNVLFNLKNDSIKKACKIAENIQNLVLVGNHNEAAEVVLSSDISMIQYFGDELPKHLIKSIFSIDMDRVNKEIIKQFLLNRIAIGQQYYKYDDVSNICEQDAKWLLENKVELEPEVRFNLRLAIGNALASQKLWASAENNYFLALQYADEVSSSSKAWAYYNTGNVLYNQCRFKESLKKYCLAGDLWLSDGNVEQAIVAYIKNVRSAEDRKQALLDINEVILHVNNGKEDNVSSIDLANILGYLFFHKAEILNDLGKTYEVEQALLKSYENRKDILGIESQTRATLAFLEIVCKSLGKFDESMEWHNKWLKLRQYDNEENLELKEKIINILDNNEYSSTKFECLENEIKNTGDNLLLFSYYVTNSAKICINNPNKALELLDTAINLDFHGKSEEIYVAYQMYAEIMRQIGRDFEAYEYLKKAFEANPYEKTLYPPLIIYTQKFSNEDDRYKFAHKWSEIEEGNPIPWIILGSCYEKITRNKDAFKAYKKALELAPNEGGNINKCIDRVMNKIIESSEQDTRNILRATDFLDSQQNEESLTIEKKIFDYLCEFKKTVEKYNTQNFWKYENGKTKWISRPEKQAQILLLLYLRSVFNPNVEVLEEVIIGEGRMDIYIIIPPGIKIIIELKMCGVGYSSSYAQGSVEQIVAYMEKKECSIGFVMIFDARRRDQAKGFDEVYKLNNKSIKTIIVNVAYGTPSKLRNFK